jgi:hypothetical protein
MSSTSFQECTLAGLNARYAEFKGSLLLRECMLDGKLELVSASVSRDVDLRRSKLSAQSPIEADRVNVGGSVYLRDEFKTDARISFEGARIESALDGIDGDFQNKAGIAIILNAAKIGGFCTFARAKFNAETPPVVTAQGTQIGGFLSFERATVEGTLMLRSLVTGANLNLSGATLASVNGPANLCPSRAHVRLDIMYIERALENRVR